ncbi:amidase family protein [Limimonas halophila]|uniref:amidase family protein n=1 Tax=Limimonas halophila TaxID=1082479 RepID=UPI001FE0084C|nr:amidase family protein [Limimonas halophila]
MAFKHFSPVELLEDVIARSEKLEPQLKMFCYVDFDRARADARAAETRMMRGDRSSELDGIPTAIKDLIPVKGMPQRFGSRAVPDTPVSLDAPSVERLRDAGAVILGKSTTSEFGSKAVGDSPLSGTTRNPWNVEMTPGGSSCGAAAMVAAGLVPYALGTDGGGSVRIPAALTGLCGIKAHFARVPVFPAPATPSLAHVGPVARTVEDTATVLSVIAGYDRRDPFTLPGGVPDFVGATKTSRKMKIAWSPTLGYGRADPEVTGLCERAVRRIEGMGFAVDRLDDVMDDPFSLWAAEFYAGVGTKLRKIIAEQPELLDPAVLDVLKQALRQDLHTYYQSVFDRYAFREKVRQLFETYDLLLTPTVPVPAFAAGRNLPPGYEDRDIVSWATFTYPFNLTGQPAASLPVGFNDDGLPVGLQIVGPAHDEAAVLSLAGTYEQANTDHIRARPAMTWAT